MKEELYIITDGGRVALDLPSPSGITLNFKSCLFSDLSSVTCSYSYTFKLPMTVRNRSALDLADDIRHKSGFIRKRLKAEYALNGVRLFTDANLYVDSMDGNYSAVLTWDVVKGLQQMKDSDVNLNELAAPTGAARAIDPEDEDDETGDGGSVETESEGVPSWSLSAWEAMFGIVSASLASAANTDPYVCPSYSAGVPYAGAGGSPIPYASKDDSESYGKYTYHAYPLPAVPVRTLLSLINGKYGTDIRLGRDMSYADLGGAYVPAKSDIIDRGVIPLVGKAWDEAKETALALSFEPRFYTTTSASFAQHTGTEDMDSGNMTVIQGYDVQNPANSTLLPQKISVIDDSPTGFTSSFCPTVKSVSYTVYGYLYVTVSANPQTTGTVPTLRIYQRRQSETDSGLKREMHEVASLSGTYVGVDGSMYGVEFDFTEDGLPLQLSSLQSVYKYESTVWRPCLYFTVDDAVGGASTARHVRTRIVPDFSECMVPHPISVLPNLPQISCVEFVKNLFLMIGSFPKACPDGSIRPVYFSDLADNIPSAPDWSAKVYSRTEMPSRIVTEAGSLAQKNYYTSKQSSTDKDIYAGGTGCITVENETLSLSKTVLTSPFSPPYLKNKEASKVPTGGTYKAYTWVSEELKFTTPAPIYGLIDCSEGRYGMGCWKVFSGMTEECASFAYLQKIMDNPYVVTEYLELTEFDLRDLDWAMPVYLDKYCAYFAVLSVQRDSTGRCKCELLKLP